MPKIEKSEIWESFRLLQILKLRCKNDKKLTEKKFKDQDMFLEEKKCPRFLSFRFYPKPKIENLEIPESVLFYFKF